MVDPTEIVSIELTPLDPLLETTEGVLPTVEFVVLGHQRDGMTRPITGARFSTSNVALGALRADTGEFQSAGVGGVATVHAQLGELGAETGLTVHLRREVFSEGVTPAERDRMDAAGPAPDAATTAATVDYPLEGAVMPLNVFPPRVMWTPRHTASPTDVYRVRLERPSATIDGYFAGAPGFDNSWRMAEEAFALLARTDVGEPIRVTVAVLSDDGLRESAPSTFRTVNAVTGGSVYYWSPPQGRILRIDVERGQRVDFLPNPSSGCIACHTVSRDGQHMTANIDHAADSGRLAGYDLTADLTAAPPPTTYQGSGGIAAASYNPDGSRLISAAHYGAQLSLLDPTTGAEVAATTGDLGTGLDPEWSPDGVTIAYSRDNNLMLLPVTGPDAFGAPTLLHDGSTLPGGAVDWHPTWSPDSLWLIFQHGTNVYTAETASLWIMPPAGGAPARLDRLNGGADREDSYRPVFSPFDSGGYFWVAFTSTRPYGNATAGVHGHKQIWVAAIRNHADGDPDLSEVAYYLDGQEPVTNVSPHWAAPACRPNSATCGVGADCCSGECGPDDMGDLHCQTPTDRCMERGSTCGGDGDCCVSLVCTAAHVCDVEIY